jgi:hypothetical protein
VAAQRQQDSTAPICQKSKEADADETSRQSVQQKPAEKLLRRQRHPPSLATMSVVFPMKGHFTVSKARQPVIGDGDTVRIARQIVEHMLWSTEWRFGVNHPVLSKQCAQEGAEYLVLRQWFQRAGQAQISVTEGLLEAVHELPAEHTAQNSHRKEKGIARMHPALVIRGKTSGRDHAMDMRVMQQVLAPSVKHAEETDFCAEVLRIRRDLQQRGCTGSK